MDDEPGTSNETSNELHASEERQQQWTKELKLIPPFTYELLQEHLGTNPNSAKDGTTGAHKHKRKGYQLFKDKYVKQVVVKPDVKKGNNQLYFIMKGCVNVSMKKKKLFCICSSQTRY